MTLSMIREHLEVLLGYAYLYHTGMVLLLLCLVPFVQMVLVQQNNLVDCFHSRQNCSLQMNGVRWNKVLW